MVELLISFISMISKNKHHPIALHNSGQVLDLVDTLHSVQLIHADLKPDNFLVRDLL